jgi:hypothetical protein
MSRIVHELDISAALKLLGRLPKGVSAALSRVTVKTARKTLKLLKPETPKQTGRKGRGKKAGGVKRLSQTLKLKSWRGRKGPRATMSWQNQANFLNYGARRYTRRKTLTRKDGKPSQGKLKPGMVNNHNSRRSKRKGWANQAWRRVKPSVENIFTEEARKELQDQINKGAII